MSQSGPAHGRADRFDGRLDAGQQLRQVSRGRRHFFLLGQHEPRERHAVGVERGLVLWMLRHGDDYDDGLVPVVKIDVFPGRFYSARPIPVDKDKTRRCKEKKQKMRFNNTCCRSVSRVSAENRFSVLDISTYGHSALLHSIVFNLNETMINRCVRSENGSEQISMNSRMIIFRKKKN